jgi:hypothetical protein
MKWFIHEMNMQKKLTDEILINDTSISKVGTSYIPIVIYECNRDKSGNKNIEIVITDIEVNNGVKSAIKNKAYDKFTSLSWLQKSATSPEINSEFSKLLSASSTSTRIKDLTLRLFQSNNYLTI